MLAGGAAIPNVFSSPGSPRRDRAARQELGGAASGLAGNPVNIGTLGGYIQWKYGPIFAWLGPSGRSWRCPSTLASEARRGSLEFVAAAPFGKRRIALEKLAAHLTVLAAAIVIFALATVVVGATFGSLPEDSISAQSAIAFAAWIGVMAIAFGGLAFALAPFLGRGLSAGIAGTLLIGGYVLSNYSASVPAFDGIAYVTPWKWTADHLPLAGQYDWASLVPVAIVAVVLLAVGVEAFARRDLGATSSFGLPAMPAVLLGQDGPVGRSFGERLPVALGWGIGLGIFGLLIGSASRSLADSLLESPDIMNVLTSVFPNVDLTTAGGFLQLVFVELGFIVVGFAAATLVAGWASDETSGRLELILASPLARARWAVRSGIGVYVAIVAMTAIIALGIGLGALVRRQRSGHPDVRDDRDGPVHLGARRDRPGGRRAVPGVDRRRGRGRDRRRDVPHRLARAGVPAAGLVPPAGADRPSRSADDRDLGLGRDRGLRRPRARRSRPRGPGDARPGHRRLSGG